MRSESAVADLKIYSCCSVESAVSHAGWWCAVIGGNIALWRAIGGIWRAAPSDDDNYISSIAL